MSKWIPMFREALLAINRRDFLGSVGSCVVCCRDH